MNKSPEQKTAEALDAMERLLTEYKTATLATVNSSGEPQASYSPTALDEKRNFYLFVSELSEHTANLQNSDQVSLLLIEDENRSNQLFARNRLTVKGRAVPVPREGEEWETAASVYRSRFGKFFDQLAQLRDFHMFRVIPQNARLVVGFGAAYDVSVEDWSSLRLLTGK